MIWRLCIAHRHTAAAGCARAEMLAIVDSKPASRF
jgi:hypothetical protein